MAVKNPTTIADRWAARLGQSREKIKEGVEGVTKNPMESALENVNAYVTGVQESVESGKYQAGLQRVTLQDWKQKMLKKGIDRIASGANEAKPEFAAFMAELLPYQQQIQAELATMPKGKGDANFQRMVFNYQKMKEFKRTR